MRLKFLAACVGGLSALAGLQGVSSAAAPEKPEANKDHWHAAYGVYVCDKYLPAVQPSGQDPVGIHTHGDGLIHIHPFVAAAAGSNAILARFFEVEPIKVTGDSIKLGSTVFKTGGKCGTKTAVVRTLTWGPGAKGKPVVRAGDPSKLKLEDQITFAFVYAPADATIPVPPSQKELNDPADLPPPPLTADELAKLPAPPMKIPTPVLAPGLAPTKLTTRDLLLGTGIEAHNGTRLYVRYRATLYNGTELDATSWVPGAQPAGLPRLGRGRLMPGLEKGLLGMKVGGIRQIIIPPAEGFGNSGGVVKPTDTLIFVVQLVAVSGLTTATST
jgi:FKBP-type peptidyl-prolyl cis-trans isomerase